MIYAFEEVAGVHPQALFVSGGAAIAMGDYRVRGRIFFAKRGKEIAVCAALDETHAGHIDLSRLLREGRLAAKAEFETRAGLTIVNHVWLVANQGARAFHGDRPMAALTDLSRRWAPSITIAACATGPRELLPVAAANRPDGHSVTEILIRGDIGEGKNTGRHVRACLGDPEQRPHSIVLDLASQGGNVDEGLEIYRSLADWPFAVYANIDRAMSMAAVIAMAADVRTIRPNGEMLLHRCAIIKLSNDRSDAAALRRIANDLEGFDRRIASIIAVSTDLDVETVEALMEPETHFHAGAALSVGLVHAIREKDVPDAPRARRASFRPISGPYQPIRADAR